MKYINADKLIAEINKRLMSVNLEELGNFGCHRVWAYNDVKDLITSLKQEQSSEDLEQAAEEFGKRQGIELAPFAREFFIPGAQWQKEQMIPVTALVNESKDFLSLSLSTEEYAKIGRRFKGGDDIEIYIKQDKK